MKCFSIDVRIVATAYILAATAEEAQAKADALKDEGLEFLSSRQLIGDDIYMTGESYHEDMPEVSLSPAMTLVGPVEGQTVDEAEDFDEESEAA